MIYNSQVSNITPEQRGDKTIPGGNTAPDDNETIQTILNLTYSIS